MFVLFGMALMEAQTSKPISVADGSSFSTRRIETKGVPEVLFCCGGPMCIPDEPCGSGLLSLGASLIKPQASELLSVANGASLFSRSIETKNGGHLLLCCGGPMCIPGEPCGSGFVLFSAGSTESQASESVLVGGVSWPSNRAVKRDSVGELLWCCGGPMCIPDEPCGSGKSNQIS
jgi:hypothetical protein